MTSLRVRRNWDFISRRTPRPVEPITAPTPTLNFHRADRAPATPSQPSAPLHFTRPGAVPAGAPLIVGTAPTVRPAPRAPRPATAPTADVPTIDNDATTLSREEPVVRLSRLQSAIGTLRIDGAGDVGWQSADGEAGASATSTALRGGPVHANRPLVERISNQQVLVGLRHVHDLRRLVVTPADTTITITTAGETVITVDGTAYIHVVGGVLEIRLEVDTSITDFGFSV